MSKPIKRAFLIQSFHASQAAVAEIVMQAAQHAGFQVTRAADSFQPGIDVSSAIQEAITSASLIIADVTDGSRNVMFELGLAFAKNKPVVLLASSSSRIPIDVAGQIVIMYDPSSPADSIARITDVLKDAAKSLSRFTPRRQKSESKKRPKVFISYSHEDHLFLRRLLIHLKPLEREGRIDNWDDTRLRAGDRWKTEVTNALSRSTVAILLVSADFLASDFITGNELPPLLRKAEEQGMRIIPIILKPCRFTRDPSLKHFQSINDPREALILLGDGQQEFYYDRVAQEVESQLQRS